MAGAELRGWLLQYPAAGDGSLGTTTVTVIDLMIDRVSDRSVRRHER